MKKFIKNNLIGIIIGIIISGTVGVIAATTISSKNVPYQNKTVNNALDELYNEATTGKELVAAAITNKGVSTTSTDTYQTMAANINNIDTDHTEIIGKINNLESKHNSDITGLNSTISNLNTILDSKENAIKTEEKVLTIVSTGQEQTVLNYTVPSCKWFIITVQGLFVNSPVSSVKILGNNETVLEYVDNSSYNLVHPTITHVGPVYGDNKIKVNVKWEWNNTSNNVHFRIIYAP